MARYLDINNLTRDSKYVKDKIIVKNGTWVAKEDIEYIYPRIYEKKKLVNNNNIYNGVIGIGMFLVDDKYSVINVPVMLNFIPNSIETLLINDQEYKSLKFEKGSTFIPNNNVVKTESHLYAVYDTFFIRGKVPNFLEYEDLSNVFSKTVKYCDSKVGKNSLPMELLTAMIARDEKDKNIYYRQLKKKTSKPVYVGLQNTEYSFKSTMAKISGGYLRDGIVAAILNKTNEIPITDRLLRT